MKEKLQEYALLAEIIGGIGIIASLVFVGLQLNQNNELMAAETRFNRLQIVTGSSTLIAESPQLAEFLAVYETREREHTPAERMQVNALMRRIFRNMEWSYFELPENEVPLAEWKLLFRQSYWIESWPEFRESLDREFVSFIEANIPLNDL